MEIIKAIVILFIRMIVLFAVFISHGLFVLFQKTSKLKTANYPLKALLFIVNIPFFIINILIAPKFD
jgi:hypothetical protein